MVMIKKYNTFISENIKDYLKPKDNETILNNLKNLSDEEKFISSCKYNIPWLTKEMLDKGVDPTCEHMDGFYLACKNGSIDVLKVLLDNDIMIENLDKGYVQWILYKFTDRKPEVVKFLLSNNNFTRNVDDELKDDCLYVINNKDITLEEIRAGE